jgi:hypothetical protein
VAAGGEDIRGNPSRQLNSVAMGNTSRFGTDLIWFWWLQTAARSKNGRLLQNPKASSQDGFVAAVAAPDFRDGTSIFNVDGLRFAGSS